MKKFSILVTFFLISGTLVACSNGNNASTQTSTAVAPTSSQETTSSSTVAQAASSSSQVATSETVNTTEIDGTYVLQEWDEVKTLTISNGSGTLESRDTDDGEIEIERVTVNGANKTVIVGDDLKTYVLNGNALTLTEGDGDVQVFTKQ